MALPLILDAEALIGAWLREHDDLIALDARVAGRTPDSLTRPWVRVTQLLATPIPRSGRLYVVDYTLHLDCYAGADAMDDFRGQAVSSLLARTVVAVLESVAGTVIDDVAVTRVSFGGGPGRYPDITMEPAHERFIVPVEILMHPAA